MGEPTTEQHFWRDLSKDLRDLTRAVEKLNHTTEHNQTQTAENREELKALRREVEELKQWKASAMTKLGAGVFVAGLAAAALISQIMKPPAQKTPTPIYIQQQAPRPAAPGPGVPGRP